MSPFPGSRLYKTGDLARLLHDGRIEFLGREDAQVKIRGYRIELGEIEAVLSEHPELAEIAVAALPEEDGGELRLVAWIRTVGEAVPDVGELRAFLGRRLPDYMFPAVFVPLDEFPRTPNGKVDREALAAAGAGRVLRGEYVAPRDELESLIARVWSEVLEVPRVGREENFFHLGGHSLVATQAASRLASVLPVELTVMWIFEDSTVALLAERVRAASREQALGTAEGIPRRPQGQSAVLSFAQQRLWWLDQLDPGNLQYNVSSSHYWLGPLQAPVLAGALVAIQQRHEALRTTFREVDGEPVQVVAEGPSVVLPQVDLRALPDAARRRELTRLAEAEARTPFDLARGPLLRTVLVFLAREEQALLLTTHHIISDGVSMAVLGRELEELYNASLAGRAARLAELPVQYADFAVWQRQHLRGEVLGRELTYWRERLAAVPVLELPTDRPRPAHRQPGGANRSRFLEAGLEDRLAALEAQAGATRFMVLLTAFMVLLRHTTGQKDFALGSPIAGRDRLEVQELIGFFINMLVLRGDLPGDPTFEEALTHVRRVCLEAYEHQHLPFEKLVEELDPERSLSHTPLFQVGFVLQPPAAPLQLENLEMRALPVSRGATKFDLTLTVLLKPEGVHAVAEYDPHLFDDTTILRLLSRYELLLSGIVERSGERLSRLPSLGAAERHALTMEWGHTRRCREVAASPYQMFLEQASARPEALALSGQREHITYGALAERAGQCGQALRALGVGPESVVALGLEPGPDQVLAILAVLAAGGAYLPLDPGDPIGRLADILEDAEAVAVVTRSGSEASLPQTLPILRLDDTASWAAVPRTSPPVRRQGDHLAYVIYTSGSTGQPKGVLIRDHEVARLLRSTESWFDFDTDETWTLFHSYAFDFSVWELWGALAYGGRLVVVPYWVRRSPKKFHDFLVRERVTVLNQTPSAFRQLSMVPGALENQPADALEWVIFGGEALGAAAVSPWLEARGGASPRLINMYGITETTVHVTFQPVVPQDCAAGAAPGIGVALPDLGVTVVDSRLEPVALGVAGEGLVRGAGLARGYLGRAALTAERFVPDPWGGTPGERLYRTGDLLRFRADGRLEHLGRIDQQVKIRGYRIELGEIEVAMRALPAVRQAVVLTRPDSNGDPQLVAYLVADATADLEGEALRADLAQQVPSHMVPSAFVVLDALPLTSQGKLDRRALPAPGETEEVEALEPPQGSLEEQVAGIWREVLGRDGIDRRASFFALGGHSLLATQVISRIQRDFGVDLPLRHLFETPTVEGLAQALEQAQDTTYELPPIQRVERDQILPLSFAQQRLWFLYRLEPQSSAYNMPGAIHLTGAFDASAFERSLNALIERHEALRTGFAVVDEEPVQVIREGRSVATEWVDLSDLHEEAKRLESQRRLAAAARKPFDLEQDDLLRLMVLRWSAQEHLVFLNLHHIIADGWSFQILRRELSALYEGFRGGREVELAELEVQYADYAVWQRQVFTEDKLTEEIDWWREQLAGAPPILELPTDRPRPKIQSDAGGRVRAQLGPQVAQDLEALGENQGITLFMGLMAVFSAVLSRWSGQQDVLLGSPVAGRGRPEIEGLIGFFVNTLVLRNDLTGDPDLLTLLSRAKETVLAAQEHLTVPFERLVEEIVPGRNTSHSPLFQVVFAVDRAGKRTGLPALVGNAVEVPVSTAKFDLVLVLGEEGPLNASAEYNTSLFDGTTIQRLLAHFEHLLTGWLEQPEEPLSALSLLAAAERQQLMVEWNDTEVDIPRDRLLSELFEARVRQAPEASAVADGDRFLSYGELDRRANQLAHTLRDRGVGPEVPVGVSLERSIEVVVAILGIVKAGGFYVPLDPSYPSQRLGVMVEDSGLSLVLTSNPEVAELALECLDPDTFDTLGRVDPPVLQGWPQSAVYVIYTSGSTGRPKGVQVDHQAIERLTLGGRYVDFESTDRLGFASNTAFDAATFEIWGALLNGGCLVVLRREIMLSPQVLASEIETRRVGILFLTAALFHEVARQTPAVFGAMRVIMAGGEAVDPRRAAEVLAANPATHLRNGYGPTESTTFAATYKVEEVSPGARSVPIGRALANTSLRVVDRSGRTVPVGVVGELCLGGEGLARGYFGDPRKTAEKFVPQAESPVPGERFYRTGDLARWLPTGDLDVLGRVDHQIKLRGFRIELGEIETQLTAQPEVSEAVVLLRPDGDLGKRLVAYVVFEEGRELAPAELRTRLAQQLPEYMVPPTFVVLDALPLNPNLKVDRRALPAPSDQRSESVEFTAPRTPVEEILAKIWQEVLGVEEVGIHDDFFALGGHSLLAIQVISRVQRDCGVDLPLRHLFETPTVEGLAQALEQSQDAIYDLPPIRRVERDQTLPLSFAQQRLWFLYRLEPQSSAYNMPGAIHLTGAFDASAFERSLNALIERHEALRTGFAVVDEEPVQVIRGERSLETEWVDLSDLHEEAKRVESQRRLAAAARKPFDLEKDDLLRLMVLRWSAQEHLVFLNLHHIIADGWSFQILRRELSALYEGFRDGREVELAELEVQYVDYAVWQRQVFTEEKLTEEIDWWREQLAGAPPILELPTDRPRPKIQSDAGGRVQARLGTQYAKGLEALGQSQGITLFMGLMAVFGAVLSRWSGQRDVLLGSPVAGRGRPEIEGLIGFFVNTLVLRNDLTGDPDLLTLLSRAKETVLAAQEHLTVPFERLVEEIVPGRNTSHSPLFQVVFAVNRAGERTGLPALVGNAVEVPVNTAKFDLILFLGEEDPLNASAEYNTSLFDGTTIQRLLAHFEHLLTGWLEQPEEPLSALSLLAPAERQQLMVEWNDTEVDLPRDRLLSELFEARVRQAPEASAVADGDRFLSYGELDRRANQLAHTLRDRGVGPEVPVGVSLERSIEVVVAILGIVKAGGFYVPLDPSYPSQRLGVMVEDSGLSLVLTSNPEVAELALECLDPDTFDTSGRVDPPVLQGWPQSAVYVIYTSGSTGRPKGVQVDHQAIERLTLGGRYVDFESTDRLGFASNTAFDAATFEIWGALLNGGCLVVLRREIMLSPQVLASEIETRRVGILFLTAALFHEVARQTPAVFGAMRVIMAGGEAVDPRRAAEVLAANPATHLRNGYGPTESTTFAATYKVEEVSPGARSVPIGRALANTSLRVVDRSGRTVPVGVVGELCLGGEGLARGYFGDPRKTAEKFVPQAESPVPGERFYRTGDLARWLPTGDLDVLGRVDHQIKLRGFRIELGEIETQLTAQPEVSEAVVLLRPDGDLGKRLVAYVVFEEGRELAPAELRTRLAQQLPEYMVPPTFVVLDALPLNPNLKVDRRALPAPSDQRSESVEFTAPRTPVEEILAKIWQEVLGVEKVGIHDDFFECGGHSLLATRITSRVPLALGVELPLRDLFEAPTVATLALRIEQRRAFASQPLSALEHVSPERVERPQVVPVPRDQPLPLSFAQQRLWFLDQLQPLSSAYNMPWAVHLSGGFDRWALERSLDFLVERHESLRTGFTMVNEEPVQVVREPRPVTVEWLDLSRLSEEEKHAESQRQLTAAAGKPFDLERDDLIRLLALRWSEQEHLLFFNLHHIIADGWSVQILNRELGALYEGFRAGQKVELAELEVQYVDYAVWQRQVFTEEVLSGEIEWWRTQLAGAPPVLELPTDRPRPKVQSDVGGRVQARLESDHGAALGALGQDRGTTLFMGFLAIFSALLSRWSGHRDVLLGSPVAGRERPEIEGLIGCFVNTLVLRNDLTGDPDLFTVLSRVRETTLAAQEHQSLPFERLVEEIVLERDTGHSPLFQVVLSVNQAHERIRLPALGGHAVDIPLNTAKFDLVLALGEESDHLNATVEYNASLFDATTMKRLLVHFEHLLTGWLEQPEAPLSALSLLAGAERQQLIVEWNDTEVEMPREGGLNEVFEAWVRQAPEALAVVDGERTLSYTELDREANRLAHALIARGVGPEVPVGLSLERSVELIVATLAILKAGGFYVPLDPSYPLQRLQMMVEDSGVSLVVGQEPILEELAVECLDPNLAQASDQVHRPSIKSWPLSAAYVMYTSGSTGRPKGVLVNQGGIERLVLGGSTVDFRANDRMAFGANPAFDAATFEIWGMLLNGGCLVVLPQEIMLSPPALAREVKEQQLSILFLTTALFHEVIRQEPDAFGELRSLVVGGEPLDPRFAAQALKQAPTTDLVNAYGPTEGTTMVAIHDVERVTPGDRSVPIGRAIANTSLFVIDRDGQPVTQGAVGELWAGGEGLARGYFGDPKRTAEKFVPAPLARVSGERLYRTGDLARCLADGLFDCLGRMDNQIKLRGFRIELGEIEAILAEQAEVEEAVVMLRSVEGLAEKQLVAYVVVEGTLDMSDLQARLARSLPEHMVPKAFVALEALPLTSNLKIDRRALPVPDLTALSDPEALSGQLVRESLEAPRNADEALVAEVFKEVLGGREGGDWRELFCPWRSLSSSHSGDHPPAGSQRCHASSA